MTDRDGDAMYTHSWHLPPMRGYTWERGDQERQRQAAGIAPGTVRDWTPEPVRA